MRKTFIRLTCATLVFGTAGFEGAAFAHKLREAGETVEVTKADIMVTPARDWNRLSGKVGKYGETWTLDGEQLNNVTFFGGIPSGEPLLRERNRKTDPLPKYNSRTLIVEVPELLERTYRTDRGIGLFEVENLTPGKFLGHDGLKFRYQYVERDGLVRLGQAHATIIKGKLYLALFEAPRLYYFEKNLADFDALIATAKL